MKKLFFIALTPFLAQAASLPSTLSSGDVSRSVEVLGFGSATRSLLSAESLGMEPGIRVGVVQSLIVTQPLQELGARDGSSPEVAPVPSLHVAKGLPFGTDIELVIMPPRVLSFIEKYGASVGWTFLTERKFPVAMSVRPHFSYAEMYNNDVTIWNYGVNVAVSKDYVWWSPYAHIGFAMADGCVRESLATSNNCSRNPGGVAGIGVKLNLALTFVGQIDIHNLNPAMSIFIGKDF